ncbi:MAG: hypothetical protein V7638_431 [Acidobacteriota bacterium]|jgi:hypothetical protein
MFDAWREARTLRREIDLLQKERLKLDRAANEDELAGLSIKISDRQQRLAVIDTDRLLLKVRQLGIELPSGKENWWWDDLDYVGPDDSRSYLTDIGKSAVSKLIREERRKNVEWWVKIIVTLTTALTGLVGALIGVFSLLKK